MKGSIVPPAELNRRDGQVGPLRKLRGDQPAHERNVDVHHIGLHVSASHLTRLLVQLELAVPGNDTLNRFQIYLVFISTTRRGLSAAHFLLCDVSSRQCENKSPGLRPAAAPRVVSRSPWRTAGVPLPDRRILALL